MVGIYRNQVPQDHSVDDLPKIPKDKGEDDDPKPPAQIEPARIFDAEIDLVDPCSASGELIEPNRNQLVLFPPSIRDKQPKLKPPGHASKFIGKAPKPLKPKAFQKVPNTIPMPMKMPAVPFKPVGEPRGRNPTQSPPGRKAQQQSPPKMPVEEWDPMFTIPVRMPEKNQIAL